MKENMQKQSKKIPGVVKGYKVTKKMEKEMPVVSRILRQLTPERVKKELAAELNKKINSPYSVFAQFYDRLMKDNKYKEWGKLVLKTIRKYHIPKITALDLACGTGRISKILADLGFQVIGIDNSRNMLRLAKLNYPKINFIHQDITSFVLNRKFDLVVSFYDSLNYLTTYKKMLEMFRCVAKHLKQEGVFLFDLNSVDQINFARHFNHQIFEFNKSLIILRHSGRKNFWQIIIDIFTKKSDNNYQRATEHHLERGYSEWDIKKLLTRANLRILDIQKETKYTNNSSQYTSRIYFWVKKAR